MPDGVETKTVTYECGCTAGGDCIAAHCPMCGYPISTHGQPPTLESQPDGGLKLRIEPCESWGKYVLEIWNGERWEALHTDYLSVVEAMKQKIEAAAVLLVVQRQGSNLSHTLEVSAFSHDPAELTRLKTPWHAATARPGLRK
jgi:hypothetical protein